MQRVSTKESCNSRPSYDEFIIRIDKLINYALNPEKADRFKHNFMVKNQYESERTRKARDELEELLKKEKLNTYVGKILSNKTFLHPEGRKHIERSIRLAGIVSTKVRRKVG